jgi:hypothetical protein
MKAKLLINGKELEVEVSWAELQKLEEMQKKKTGYERAEDDNGTFYWVNGIDSKVYGSTERCNNNYYDNANYYSDKTVAKNNARADKLMRQLRRFAVEHRETELNWNDHDQNKYVIQYAYYAKELCVDYWRSCRDFGCIFFGSQETAKLAIDAFHDELVWYFTEYKDSL